MELMTGFEPVTSSLPKVSVVSMLFVTCCSLSLAEISRKIMIAVVCCSLLEGWNRLFFYARIGFVSVLERFSIF